MSVVALPFNDRKFAESHYKSSFRASNASRTPVLQHDRSFNGFSALDRIKLNAALKLLQVPLPLAPGASVIDEQPPSFFLAALAEPESVTFGNDAAHFFAGAGPANPPAAIRFGKDVAEGDLALLASQRLTLPANGTVALRFISGYLPDTRSVDDLVAKWRGTLESGSFIEQITDMW